MVITRKFESTSVEQTVAYGEQLAKLFKKGDIVCFFGDLGTGKTTMIKGIAKGLKVSLSKVNSPTFVLMNVYQGKLPIYHFDLYRLQGNDSIASIGYDEFLYDNGLAVIEWAEHFGDLMPEEFLKVEIAHKSEGQRSIKVTAQGKRYREIISKIKTPA